MLVCDVPLLRSSPSAGTSTPKELEALTPNEYWLLEVMHIINGIARESSLCALALLGGTNTVGEEHLQRWHVLNA